MLCRCWLEWCDATSLRTQAADADACRCFPALTRPHGLGDKIAAGLSGVKNEVLYKAVVGMLDSDCRSGRMHAAAFSAWVLAQATRLLR